MGYNNEPLWGTDIDALRHEEIVGHSIELVVSPNDDMRIHVIVYHWTYIYGTYRWVSWRVDTSQNPGDSVPISWSSRSGREYLIVMSPITDHGGYYDLDLTVTS